RLNSRGSLLQGARGCITQGAQEIGPLLFYMVTGKRNLCAAACGRGPFSPQKEYLCRRQIGLPMKLVLCALVAAAALHADSNVCSVGPSGNQLTPVSCFSPKEFSLPTLVNAPTAVDPQSITAS